MASHLELGELIEQIADVLDAQPVAFAYLFGSHVNLDKFLLEATARGER